MDNTCETKKKFQDKLLARSDAAEMRKDKVNVLQGSKWWKSTEIDNG